MDKKHLIKIVEYLLEDTIIDYDHTTIQLIGSDLEYDIEFIHDEFFKMLWVMLEYNYGLNGDEIVYVFGNYLYQINKNIKLNGSINESVENREKYLDKIVQYIIDDTVIDYDKNLCKLPYLYNPIPIIPPFIIPSPYYYSFLTYCKDIYGLTGEEIIYVWEKYKSIVDDKGSINESVDSKKTYLDKIVQYIIDDTVIDYEEREIKYPYFSNILLLTPNKQQHLPVHSFRAFSIYCKDMYGLNIEEIQYVWHHYIKNSELFYDMSVIITTFVKLVVIPKQAYI